MKISKDKKQLRYQFVQYALKHGVKPSARTFHTSPQTVRKWRNRFLEQGYDGLKDLSKRPHHSPNETPSYVKEHIIMLKKDKYKRIGAEQIRSLEDLPQAPKTMRKIWRQAGISSRKRKKKYITKNKLAIVVNSCNYSTNNRSVVGRALAFGSLFQSVKQPETLES